MATNKTYTIKSFIDLVQLDDRQLDACLVDIKLAVKNHRNSVAMIEKMRQQMIAGGVPEDVANDAFKMTSMVEVIEWTDDGKSGGTTLVNVTLKHEDGSEEVLGEVEMKIPPEDEAV